MLGGLSVTLLFVAWSSPSQWSRIQESFEPSRPKLQLLEAVQRHLGSLGPGQPLPVQNQTWSVAVLLSVITCYLRVHTFCGYESLRLNIQHQRRWAAKKNQHSRPNHPAAGLQGTDVECSRLERNPRCRWVPCRTTSMRNIFPWRPATSRIGRF